MSNDNQFDQPIAGHDYDGIQEFDNPLPMWWLWTFFGTIIFAFMYFIHYQLGAGPNLDQELQSDLTSIKNEAATASAQAGGAGAGETGSTAEDLNAVMNDPARIAAGKVIFAGKCASCHGPEGQGLIGPNLTDKFWIHGTGKPEDIVLVISKGVLDKGMPPWEAQLKPAEINSAMAFVRSLKGTNPPNPKPPQGNEVKDY